MTFAPLLSSGRIAGMKVVSLQSGSNGNCFFVESGDVSLVFDAGISGKQAEMPVSYTHLTLPTTPYV